MPAIPKQQKQDGHRLSISLFDLDRLPPAIRERLAPSLDAKIVVRPTREPGDAAVGFKCSLVAAATWIDVLRSQDRQVGDRPMRAWVNRGQGWVSVPPDVVLTALAGGKVVLSSWMTGKAVAVPPPKTGYKM